MAERPSLDCGAPELEVRSSRAWIGELPSLASDAPEPWIAELPNLECGAPEPGVRSSRVWIAGPPGLVCKTPESGSEAP
eukprot:13604637-Alexandrium_andersonii.AAC.1